MPHNPGSALGPASGAALLRPVRAHPLAIQVVTDFGTLRGFLDGSEPDEGDYFAYSATLRVFANNLDFDEISRKLGLSPTESHRKGDKRGPRSPGYQHDMWSYSPAIPEDRPLNEHIDALWSAVRPAKAFLREMKQRASVDVFLGYRSNIDHAGIEMPHTCLEMFVELEIPFGVSIIIA